MATVGNRMLLNNDVRDVAAISVAKADYKDKWGVIEVLVNSCMWGGGTPAAGNFGRISIGPAGFDADSDFNLVDKATIANQVGPLTVGKKYFFAVNNGEIGPGGRENEDGTWDLLLVTVEVPVGQSFVPPMTPGIGVITDYTLTFTDLTPA